MTILNLPADTKVAGLDLYHQGNLDKNSIVSQRDLNVITARTDDVNLYTKICTIDLKDKDRYSLAAFTIYDLTTPLTKITFADIIIKVYIQGDVSTGTKTALLLCTNNNNFAFSNVIGVISKNDATGFVVDVYYKHPSKNIKLHFKPVTNTSNRAGNTGITYYTNQTCVSVTGTQIICSGLDAVTQRIWNVTGNLGDIPANSMATVSIPCVGARYGDIITVSPSDAPSISITLLWAACCKATDVIELRVFNTSATTKTVNTTWKIQAVT